ncbi:MAG: ADP-ribosylation factor-like protein, partial [Acidobacteria bacterium]|nr:ADP-ribosylation factor-like protein [Acidobacteriota bacterium]
MARDEAYRKVERKIEEARRSGATELNLDKMGLTELPESLGQLRQLEKLELNMNNLKSLPESLGNLTRLRELWLYGNRELTLLPESLANLVHLELLHLAHSRWMSMPDWLRKLRQLKRIYLQDNQLTDLPGSLGELEHLETLYLVDNPLNPELAAAYKEGFDAVKRYLRAKAGAQVVLNEAKLILIGEGEVGKSCLLGALRGDEWVEDRPTTHGIEIKPVKVTDPDTGTEITLNGWDFGGQRVYRPTHQLFFSAPAVYLVVWKPREGPQQGFVKEWIKLVKHREPDAKILVVATHGGPGQRQPDVDRQEIWDLFGRDTVHDFFLVESRPDEKTGERRGIAELKEAIARVAASLPEMGRTVPARWQQAREALKQTGAAYLPLEQALEICREHKMDEEEARLFVAISHRLGHLIHYEHDPALRDIVVLKPDWLATAISFVLDDEQTRDRHGLVDFARLSQLWNDPAREEEFRYDHKLHPVFLRLMERFDLSYKVALPSDAADEIGFWQRVRSVFAKAPKPEAEAAKIRYTSLIAQLVPDVRPEQDLHRVWLPDLAVGDEQQVQICRIVDAKSGQSATAEGLFYQLIVRLHKFSLGRVNYEESVHWQRGLVLDDDYNGRALLEHIGNDIRITVRAPFPLTLLSVLTREVKWLVESFWEGLRCEVVVPCVEPCGMNKPGSGAFEVQKLVAFKRQGMTMFPCFVSGCSQAQDIDWLLRNAPAARRTPVEQLLAQGFDQMRSRLDGVREQLNQQDRNAEDRFRVLDLNDRRIMSQVEDAFTGLMQALTDEAKDGPRLFSFQPVASGFFDLPTWLSQKFLLTLWCEHSRLPLPALNGAKDRRGVYELDLPREWFVKAAPFLKVLTGTLGLVLPVASSAVKLPLDDAIYKGIEKQLDLAQKTVESVSKGMEKAKDLLGQKSFDVENGEAIAAQGAILRQLHAMLKQKDPSFGGLVRVRNKRQEFLWVHS